MPNCPECRSTNVIRNGTIHNGKPKFACTACGRQFVEQPQNHRISDEIKAPIDKLLLERISLAGIARVTGVSIRWVQYYVNAKYATVPQETVVPAQKND